MIAISESITDHSICMFDETVNKSAVISCRSIFQKAGVTAMMYVKDYMHSTRKKYDIKKQQQMSALFQTHASTHKEPGELWKLCYGKERNTVTQVRS